jgi:hypothetical protein
LHRRQKVTKLKVFVTCKLVMPRLRQFAALKLGTGLVEFRVDADHRFLSDVGDYRMLAPL